MIKCNRCGEMIRREIADIKNPHCPKCVVVNYEKLNEIEKRKTIKPSLGR
jgi:hypothetical protein